jgi:glucose-6-phosphate 1-dehydrogenase
MYGTTSSQLVILGATGDLTGRYLMPAIAKLAEQEKLPVTAPIVGVGKQGWGTANFREHIAGRMKQHAADVSSAARERVCKMLEYRSADVAQLDQLATAIGHDDKPAILYLALPPRVAAKVIGALAHIRLPEHSRIVCEKPFGHDAASAENLNELLRQVLPEHHVFRIDHFLGKQEVQNVLGLRFANRFFEYLWNRDHIERIDIKWDETIALEGRAGYYDSAGALRDMIQNHLLQLLCLVAMEAPATFHERDFRDRKVDVLRAVRKLSPEEVAMSTIRARYTAGEARGEKVPNYVDEPGVQAERQTETFAQVTLWIDNWRWIGVPFVLRTGKALGADHHEIVVHFRKMPFLPFQVSTPTPNALKLRFDCDRIELSVNINGAGEPFDLENALLSTELHPQRLPEYSRLLLDVFQGDATLSIRGDEAVESWRIVEPILSGWAQDRSPMLEYEAGSEGPLDTRRDDKSTEH